jgi:hypothetical protein
MTRQIFGLAPSRRGPPGWGKTSTRKLRRTVSLDHLRRCSDSAIFNWLLRGKEERTKTNERMTISSLPKQRQDSNSESKKKSQEKIKKVQLFS